MKPRERSPIVVGVLLALSAAIAFGLTAPAIAHGARGVGTWSVAALLYVGAAASSLVSRFLVREVGNSLRRSDASRIVVVALFGAALAPALFAFGIARTGATIASLVLNLEAVFTVAFAWLVYREPIGRRVGMAVAAMVAGGALLTVDAGAGDGRLGGLFAVVAATACWAADNTWTRALSGRDPSDVVLAKSALGSVTTGTIAVFLGERAPTWTQIVVLLGCGAVGYGASLRLYLLAQRRIGAARTGSVFAVGPFVGAAVSWMLGERDAGIATLAGSLAFGLGVYLHVTESHEHALNIHGDHAHGGIAPP